MTLPPTLRSDTGAERDVVGHLLPHSDLDQVVDTPFLLQLLVRHVSNDGSRLGDRHGNTQHADEAVGAVVLLAIEGVGPAQIGVQKGGIGATAQRLAAEQAQRCVNRVAIGIPVRHGYRAAQRQGRPEILELEEVPFGSASTSPLLASSALPRL